MDAVCAPRWRPGWVLDEVAYAGRENLDTGHVARYDRKEDAGAAEELVLLQRLGFTRTSMLVDIGAGTGQFALAAASTGARVVAVDVSPVMLDVLRRKAIAAELTNIEVVQAGFVSYEHDGAPADFVYSRYALHHLPDFWKAVALARMHSILRPAGVLRLSDVVYNLPPATAEERVRDEHSTFTWLLEPMIARSGFDIEEAAYSDDGIFAQYVLRVI